MSDELIDQPDDGSVRGSRMVEYFRAHGSNFVMGGLIAISAFGLYAMHLHSRTPDSTVARSSTAETIGPQTIVAFQQSLAETRRMVEAVQSPDETIQVSFSEMSNPFTYVRQRPPLPVTVPATMEPVRTDDVVLRAEVLKLNLQSILCGRTNYCLVNNQLFTEGQTIGKFVIERITSEAVHLRSGDFTFDLRMNRR